MKNSDLGMMVLPHSLPISHQTYMLEFNNVFFINDHLIISDFRPVLLSSISSATVGTDHIGAVTCFSTSTKVQGKVQVVQERIRKASIESNRSSSNKKLQKFKRLVQLSNWRSLSQSQEISIINISTTYSLVNFEGI